MAFVTYNISASYVGGALGDSEFLLYHTECGVGSNLITQVTKTELTEGVSIQVDENVESIYLVPVLDDPLGSDCILGCLNEWSELSLSNYVPPSPSPSTTPSVTPTPSPSPVIAPSPSITPTPSPSPQPNYEQFGDHLMYRISSTRIEVKVEGPSYIRAPRASAIANAFGDGNVPQSTDQNGNNKEAILHDYQVYTEDASPSFLVTIAQTGGTTSKVWWYDDGNDSYVIFDQISVPLGISFPTTATNLKYLEV